MSHSLIKLIDYSLIPAILIILGKIVGIYFVASLFSITWALQSSPSTVLSFTPVTGNADVQLLSSYSDLVMFTLVCLGFVFVVMQAVYLHNTHISVKNVSKLLQYNLMFLVQSSFELYHAGLVWFIFTWVATAAVGINVLAGKTYPWVGIVALVFSLGLSVMLARDFFLELELTKKRMLSH